jgi:hypothetical protein
MSILTISPDHDSEIYQDMLDKALDLMETPEGTEFMYYNFSLLNTYSTLFKQRGQVNSFKRIYHIMKNIFEKNYQKMEISHSLMFILADYDYTEQNSELADLVFQNVLKKSVNMELENLYEIFSTLGMLLLKPEQKKQLR